VEKGKMMKTREAQMFYRRHKQECEHIEVAWSCSGARDGHA